MGQYLIIKDVMKDSLIASFSRSNDITERIMENNRIPYDTYTRLDNIDASVEDVSADIQRAEARIAAMLIKRDFEIEDYITSKEYLAELYELRGSLRMINSILSENKDIQMSYS